LVGLYLGVITPIPKGENRKFGKTCSDFRGITLCPIISKNVEHTNYFDNNEKSKNISVKQFGFKKGVGCREVIHLLKHTVDLYNTRESTVYVGTIDLQKAFDKVNHHALFKRLLDLKTPLNIILVIRNWYEKRFSKVRVKNDYSDDFKLSAGVIQGGILSPLLFSLFVDVLLQELEKLKLGCHIKNMCFNLSMYADDLILLSSMQLIMLICN